MDYPFGTPGGIRTPDLLVRSQALYPAELQARAAQREIYYHFRPRLSTLFSEGGRRAPDRVNPTLGFTLGINLQYAHGRDGEKKLDKPKKA